MIKPSSPPAHTSLSRLPWKCLQPSHRKPARFVKEIPDLSWRKARPGRTFYWASCTQAVEQADVLAGPRRPLPHLARSAAGTPAIQPPTQKEAHYATSRGKVEARDITKPASAYSSGGSPSSADERPRGRKRGPRSCPGLLGQIKAENGG